MSKPLPFARAVVVNRKGKFLVVKNITRNRYEFPGGKQDKHESSVDCAFRELKEEIGIRAQSAFHCCSAEIHVDSGHWLGDFWLVLSYRGKPRIIEEHKLTDLRWVTIDELSGLPQIPRVCLEVARNAAHDLEHLKQRKQIYRKFTLPRKTLSMPPEFCSRFLATFYQKS